MPDDLCAIPVRAQEPRGDAIAPMYASHGRDRAPTPCLTIGYDPAVDAFASTATLCQLLDRVQAFVTIHVRRERAAGRSLQRVIGDVRCLVAEAESCEGSSNASDALLARVVRWTIEAYDDMPAR